MAGQERVPESNWDKASKLAYDILDECRVQLMLKFRFLDLALWHMPLEPIRTEMHYPIATDGTKIYYEPFAVVARFESSFSETVRDFLHMILHCIFRHPYDTYHKRLDAWWLSCDIIAESVSMDICGTRFESPDDPRRKEVIGMLKMNLGILTPNKLYKEIDKAMRVPESSAIVGMGNNMVSELQLLFERDDHFAWPGSAKNQEKQPSGDIMDVPQPGKDGEGDEPSPEFDNLASTSDGENPDEGEEQGGNNLGETGEESESSETEEEEQNQEQQEEKPQEEPLEEGESNGKESPEEQEWHEIGKQVEMDLQTFSKEWGDEASSLMTSLRIANRKVFDYTDFLRRFSVLTEDMKINNDEFDYIFYTYGIDLYGNIPLVEPLEYMDTHRVRDFVIALDTSGSCSGELIKRFVQYTFDILMQSQSFGNRVNVHIVQCDARVQADTKVTNIKEMKEYLDGFVVRGFGGTDFRPVFDYVNRLRDEGELEDLQGMLYFTDGLGYFPEAAPEYDVAFVFYGDGTQELPPVPPWAMSVQIDEDGIEAMNVDME
ncbi:MAG: VWA-like domain-containing protein [Coriobacteriales bacterium]